MLLHLVRCACAPAGGGHSHGQCFTVARARVLGTPPREANPKTTDAHARAPRAPSPQRSRRRCCPRAASARSPIFVACSPRAPAGRTRRRHELGVNGRARPAARDRRGAQGRAGSARGSGHRSLARAVPVHELLQLDVFVRIAMPRCALHAHLCMAVVCVYLCSPQNCPARGSATCACESARQSARERARACGARPVRRIGRAARV